MVTSLRTLLKTSSGRCPKNDKLWGLYFALRSSETFVAKWVTFLGLAQTSSSPILFQHLTDLVFHAVIHKQLAIHIQPAHDVDAVTVVEANALRYAAGYVCHHLCKKITQAHHPLKDDLVSCLTSLVKIHTESEKNGTAEEWTNALDRGGLVHIQETTFALFSSMEDEIRDGLKQLVTEPNTIKMAEFIKKIERNDDVQFYWCIISADFEIDDMH